MSRKFESRNQNNSEVLVGQLTLSTFFLIWIFLSMKFSKKSTAPKRKYFSLITYQLSDNKFGHFQLHLSVRLRLNYHDISTHLGVATMTPKIYSTRIRRDVHDHDALKRWESDFFAITLEHQPLIQVLAGLENNFTTSKYCKPQHVFVSTEIVVHFSKEITEPLHIYTRPLKIYIMLIDAVQNVKAIYFSTFTIKKCSDSLSYNRC